MQNEACFDGFSESHLVREHHPCGVPVGDFLRDIKLVRNQVDAATEESSHRGLSRAMKQLECESAKLERFRRIKASGKQTLLRPTQTETVAELRLGLSLIFASVNQQTMFLDNLFNGEFLVVLSPYLVADSKAHTLQRRQVVAVSARVTCRLELDLDASAARLHDRG